VSQLIHRVGVDTCQYTDSIILIYVGACRENYVVPLVAADHHHSRGAGVIHVGGRPHCVKKFTVSQVTRCQYKYCAILSNQFVTVSNQYPCRRVQYYILCHGVVKGGILGYVSSVSIWQTSMIPSGCRLSEHPYHSLYTIPPNARSIYMLRYEIYE
jgi:hypothetical protein